MKLTTLTMTIVAASLSMQANAEIGKRGTLDLQEAQSHLEARFNKADANQDGQVDLDEFLALSPPEHKGKQRKHKQRHKKRAQKRKMKNANPEFKAALKEKRSEHRALVQDELFALLDTDHNGNISVEEFNAGNNRKLAREASKRVKFKALDTDQDGLLNLSEMSARLEKLRTMDTDADGKVSREERRAARQAQS